MTENDHVDGILDCSIAPARVEESLAARAIDCAQQVVSALDYVGVLAVEMFVVADDAGTSVLVNEIAPRPHNSGHWTLDASVTSQFAQQIRAVCNVGLGSTEMTSPGVAMVNLLGDEWFVDSNEPVEPNWSVVFDALDAALHLYGKAEPRRGRKMGHLTVRGATPDEARERALDLRRQLTRR